MNASRKNHQQQNHSQIWNSKKINRRSIQEEIRKIKSEETISINTKASSLKPNKYPSSYDQPSADLIKSPLLKSPWFHYHASQFTKHISSMTLEGNTLLQLQKVWYAICYSFCQSLSTNNICPPGETLLAKFPRSTSCLSKSF